MTVESWQQYTASIQVGPNPEARALTEAEFAATKQDWTLRWVREGQQVDVVIRLSPMRMTDAQALVRRVIINLRNGPLSGDVGLLRERTEYMRSDWTQPQA